MIYFCIRKQVLLRTIEALKGTEDILNIWKHFKVHKNKLATTGGFQQCCILTSVDSEEPVEYFLSLETPNGVQSVA